MGSYQYQAKDYSGNPNQGVIEAESEAQVANILAAQGLIPLAIKQEKKSLDLNQFFIQLTNQDKIKTDPMVVFCRQMGILLFAGVPINAALQRLQETTESKPLAAVLKEVIQKVNSGYTLTAALKKYPRAFSPIMISIMDAGENSGHLDKAFAQLADFFQLETKTSKQIKTATRYPKIVMVTLLGAIICINIMVIPAVAKMFAAFHMTLPLSTRFFLGMSAFITQYILYMVILSALGFYALKRYIATPKGSYQWDYLKLKLPVLGTLLHRIYLARFSRSLGMIMSSGVPFVQGIGLASQSMGNVYMNQKMHGMIESITRGESLSRAAISTGLFTPLVIQMLKVAEETGEMEGMLLHVAGFYEQELEYDMTRIASLIEPLIMVVLGGLVLMLALAVFVPMWDMIGGITH